MDATSRILVFEALKRWRHNKTTVVITHDLSQIDSGDFVYVLKDGRVVEQGFRYDLESVSQGDNGRGEFRKMMEQQSETGGFLPEKDVAVAAPVDVEVVSTQEDEQEVDEIYVLPAHLKHQSLAVRPLSVGNWMFDVIADLTTTKPPVSLPPATSPIVKTSFANKAGCRLTIQIPSSPPADSQFNIPAPLPSAYNVPSRRHQSLQFTPTTPVFSFNQKSPVAGSNDDDEDAWKEKVAVHSSYVRARMGRKGVRSRAFPTPKVETPSSETTDTDNKPTPASFWSLMRSIYPTVPNKPILFLGLLICLCSGGMTPLFSFLLSRLLFEVSSGAQNVSTINQFGGIVLGIAALDGVFLGLKYYVMEYCGTSWITNLRSIAIQKILKQDKKWFDIARHSPSDIVQAVVQDGYDAKNLVSVVWGQFLVVGAMLGIGLFWALIRGWQLTLAGFAIAPIFAGVMVLQTRLVVKCEARNKKAREDVARGYYDVRLSLFFFFGFD